jgi:hypothetical protein
MLFVYWFRLALQGFVPARRVTFLSRKVTKSIAPNTLPCGFPAMLMEFGSLRNSLTLKQVLAQPRIPLRFSAAYKSRQITSPNKDDFDLPSPYNSTSNAENTRGNGRSHFRHAQQDAAHADPDFLRQNSRSYFEQWSEATLAPKGWATWTSPITAVNPKGELLGWSPLWLLSLGRSRESNLRFRKTVIKTLNLIAQHHQTTVRL